MFEKPEDREVVRLIYQYRILSQRQIETLLNRSQSTVQRRLARLYDHQYLERIEVSIHPKGSSPLFYILDQRGREVMRRLGVEDFTGQPKKDVKETFIEHTLAINDFRIAASLACQANAWEMVRWITENEVKAQIDRVHVEGKQKPVVPDSFFNVYVPDKGDAYFFLELDRGSETLERFRTKIAAYVAYYKTGAYTRRYNAKGFRVLTVVDNVGELRLRNLVNETQKIENIGRRFWFAHLEEITPETIFTHPIWTVAGSTEKKKLFELEA